MTRYSVQSRDRISVKGYTFFSLAKNMGKNIGKNISKVWVVNTANIFSIMLNSLQQMHLKLL